MVHGGLSRNPERQLTHLKAPGELSHMVSGGISVVFERFSMFFRCFSVIFGGFRVFVPRFSIFFQCVFGGFQGFFLSYRSVMSPPLQPHLLEDATREPTVNPWGMEGDAAMDALVDTLWADPSDAAGSFKNPRGCSHLWGPDYTRRFLKASGLQLIIRSHQVPEDQPLGRARGGIEVVGGAGSTCTTATTTR